MEDRRVMGRRKNVRARGRLDPFCVQENFLVYAPLSLPACKIPPVFAPGRQSRRRPARVETLERRLVLSVTVTSPIGLQDVPENTPTTIDVAPHITDTSVTGTVVEFSTTLGVIDVELFNSAAPNTVNNFLQYVNSGLYNGTIIHRTVNDQTNTPPFQVVQGGGFLPDGSPISTFAPVANEFSMPNVRGTIAMAKPGNNPDGATSQWFFNDSTNPALDDPANDGGFTVFGMVINGLNIVDAIEGLPTVDGSALNPQFGTTLPVLSSTASNLLASSNLVTVNSVTELPKVSLHAVSDNLELINPTVSGSQLTLNPAPGRSGFCHVTVTASDFFGNLATERFVVQVVPSAARMTTLTLGAGHPRTVTYSETGGLHATVSLSGPGSAVLTFGGDALKVSNAGDHVAGDNVQLISIAATGTTGASALSIRGSGGPRRAPLDIGPITTDGSLAMVRLRRAALEAGLYVASGLGTANIDYLNSESISVGGTLAPGRLLAIRGLFWSDVNVVSAEPIASIVVDAWSNSDNVSESIQAPYVRSVRSKGNFTPGLQLSGTGAPHSNAIGNLNIKGTIGGTWAFTGALPSLSVGSIEADFNGKFNAPLHALSVRGNVSGMLSAPAIGMMSVRGSMTAATLTLTNVLAAGTIDLAALHVSGGINMSTISAAGNIGLVSAGTISGSNVYAGVGTISGGGNLPALSSDFAASASIGAVTLHPPRKTIAFTNSAIAARSLGNLSLASTAVNNGGFPFGIAGATLAKLAVHDVTNKADLLFSHITSQSQVATEVASKKLKLGDFQIVIVS